MATNPASYYGRDVACVLDADELFTEAVGIDVVRQDAIHRITTDDVLGDDGTGSLMVVGWGFDCRRLLGLSTLKLTAHQPILAEVLTRDQRVQQADVTLTPVRTNGLADVALFARCVTALGPFEIVIKSIANLDASDLVGQA